MIRSGSEREVERLSFFVSAAAERSAAGWRIAGEPGFTAGFWARPGDVLDEVTSPDDGRGFSTALTVVEVGPAHLVVIGDDGSLIRAGHVLSGERPAAT